MGILIKLVTSDNGFISSRYDYEVGSARELLDKLLDIDKLDELIAICTRSDNGQKTPWGIVAFIIPVSWAIYINPTKMIDSKTNLPNFEYIDQLCGEVWGKLCTEPLNTIKVKPKSTDTPTIIDERGREVPMPSELL